MKCFIRFVSFVSIITVSAVMTCQPYAEAGMYKWTDAQGNVNFTDDVSRVPQSQRETVQAVSLPEPTSSDDTVVPPDNTLDAAPGSIPEIDNKGVVAAPGGADMQCLEAIDEERERLKKQLAEDQERLDWVIKKRRYTTVRKNRALQKERATLQERIAETQKKLTQDLPRREMACGR